MQLWLIACVSLILVSTVVYADIATYYPRQFCKDQGYEINVMQDSDGRDIEMCIFPDRNGCKTSDFMAGTCGIAYNKHPCAQIGDWPGYQGCCPGLKAIPEILNPETGDCSNRVEDGSLCSDCGNGNCEIWENQCNCPGDCNTTAPGKAPTAQVCSKPGAQPSLSPCCAGSVAINYSMMDDHAVCTKTLPHDHFCSECGNGACEPWENQCNCPTDCAHENMTTSSALSDSSPRQGSDAIGVHEAPAGHAYANNPIIGYPVAISAQETRHVRLLGIIPVTLEVTVYKDQDNRTICVHKPFWSFLALSADVEVLQEIPCTPIIMSAKS